MIIKRLNKTKALDIMRTVEGSERFFASNGAVFSNLPDLGAQIQSMPQDIFNHHCNSQKCDFALWIQDILHDDVLAQNISKAKGVRATIEGTIKKRIEQLAKYL